MSEPEIDPVTDASSDARSDSSSSPETDALVSRLRVIEDQPLDARAASFAQVHDELRARLEGGDASPRA